MLFWMNMTSIRLSDELRGWSAVRICTVRDQTEVASLLKVDVRHNIDQVLREVGTVQRNIRDRAIGAAHD